MLLVQDQCSVRVTNHDRQVRIGVQGLSRELGVYIGRLGLGVAALAGTEPDKNQLVVLAALQL
jgi:hypothetical protein